MAPTSAFMQVAQVGDIPLGRLRRAELHGRLICLANVEGVIYAVDDDCTHICTPLSQGTLDGATLTCPLHLARFDVRTGRVLRGPARDNLRAYLVRIVGEEVLVADPDAAEP